MKSTKAIMFGKAQSNVPVLHPDNHDHVRQQTAIEVDKKQHSEEAPFEKKRAARGTR